jgi:hypothetical protein
MMACEIKGLNIQIIFTDPNNPFYLGRCIHQNIEFVNNYETFERLMIEKFPSFKLTEHYKNGLKELFNELSLKQFIENGTDCA